MTMTEFTGPEGPIREVDTGMTVVDADGNEVGTVDDVRMADPGTDTAAGQATQEPGDTWSWLADAFADSGLSQQARERLARLGYVRVDASGFFSGHRYVESDQIASVSGDRVHLSVAADELFR
jgi:hypothetical protein